MTRQNDPDHDDGLRAIRISSLITEHREGRNPRISSRDWGTFCRALGEPLSDAQATALYVDYATVGGGKIARSEDLIKAAQVRVDHLAKTNRSKASNAEKARAAKAARAAS